MLVMNEDQYPEIFIHTFSLGAGMWGVSQRMQKQVNAFVFDVNPLTNSFLITKNPAKYDSIPKRVIGQIFDSAFHPSKAIVAIPFSLYPKNRIMQSFLKCFLWVHLKVYGALQVHYNDAIENFYEHRATSPALFFASKIDPIGTVDFIESVVKRYKERNIDVTYKCFDDSEHVKHYQKYPEEYMAYIHQHWDKVKLLDRK